jgi:23S rRNA (cytidine1920-2'-O)/16S rRNA (cytidine1409-2'-O)-methyltransferase
VAPKGKAVLLVDELARQRPEVADPVATIEGGYVLVDGRFVDNPRSRVRAGCSIVVRSHAAMRGSAKLAAALERFEVRVAGRVALDAGAAAGGFTRVLLDAGARRVYAVDAGHGQLLGSLRQDPRVVNMESTNLAGATVPEPVDLVTLDLSYLALADAVGQLPFEVATGADLIALVKPMFELHLDHAPSDRASLDRALALATAGIEAAGWHVVAHMDSPVTGTKGARELLLWAQRQSPRWRNGM